MSLTEDLRKLILKPARGNGKLPTAPERDGFPAARGDANYADDISEGGSGGITPPFTEIEDSRTYFVERDLKSSDDVFVIVYAPIQSAEFRDRYDQTFTVNYVDE